MAFDQNNLPEWNSTGTEPPQSKKDSGFSPGDKPPADWFNWIFNKTFKSLQNLFSNAQDKNEKGKANGYAALDANGKVVNADGSFPGGVTSVNNKTGAVTLTKSDVGLSNVDNVQQAAKEDFDAHTADTTSHITAAERTSWNNKIDKNAPITWITPTLLNGWVDYGTPYNPIGYSKDELGIVRLRGLIKNGTLNSATVLFVLPVGYRPGGQVRAVVSTSTGTGDSITTSIVVKNDGSVILADTNAKSTFLALENISFVVGQ